MRYIQVEKARNLLTANNIPLDPGLNDEEMHLIELTYNVKFPPDLRLLLSGLLPRVEHFPNWRNTSPENIRAIRQKLNQPTEDLIAAVVENDFWIDQWGLRPKDLNARSAYIEMAAKSAPKLIPLFFHRYLASEPNVEGNPVYSMHHNDIIFYGSNLYEYLRIEMHDLYQEDVKDTPVRHIPFWGDLVT